MRKPLFALALGAGLSFAAVGCGGSSSAAGEPLLSGALAGSYDGHAFTPTFGFATVYKTDNLIGFGDGPVNCGSPAQTDPPSGNTAVVVVPAMAAGTYSSVFVQLYRNVGGFAGVGSNGGTLTIASVTDQEVAGSITYDFTSSDGKSYSFSGSFDVTRCPK